MAIVIRKHQMVLSIMRHDIYTYKLPNHEWREGYNTSTIWRQGEQGVVVSTTNIYQGGLKHKLSGEEAKEGVSTINTDKRQGKSTTWR